MGRFADYECENEKCDEIVEEMFLNTEKQPEYLEEKCSKCGGRLKRGLNFKNNCHRWKHRDHGGI